MRSDKKIYFASDLHLGIPDEHTSREREIRFVRWLDSIKTDAEKIYLLGDLFDFWFEYAQVVPRGHVRVLGKLAELRDAGIPVEYFTGNHDQWMKNYFEQELNIPVHHHWIRVELNGKKFILGHGDGLGPGDGGYKFIKSVFSNPFCRWLFARVHPNLGVWLGKKWSRNNRLLGGADEEKFLGEDKEWLVGFCREILKTDPIDFFIFGHRHLALDYKLSETSRYVNLGDWIRFNSYAEFDGENLSLKFFESKN